MRRAVANALKEKTPIKKIPKGASTEYCYSPSVCRGIEDSGSARCVFPGTINAILSRLWTLAAIFAEAARGVIVATADIGFTKQIHDVNSMIAPCTSRIREIFFRIAAGREKEREREEGKREAKVTSTAAPSCKYALGNSICQERRS